MKIKLFTSKIILFAQINAYTVLLYLITEEDLFENDLLLFVIPLFFTYVFENVSQYLLNFEYEIQSMQKDYELSFIKLVNALCLIILLIFICI